MKRQPVVMLSAAPVREKHREFYPNSPYEIKNTYGEILNSYGEFTLFPA
jgi:hypothetical protein